MCVCVCVYIMQAQGLGQKKIAKSLKKVCAQYNHTPPRSPRVVNMFCVQFARAIGRCIAVGSRFSVFPALLCSVVQLLFAAAVQYYSCCRGADTFTMCLSSTSPVSLGVSFACFVPFMMQVLPPEEPSHVYFCHSNCLILHLTKLHTHFVILFEKGVW